MHNLVLTPISIESLTDKIALKTVEFLSQNSKSETSEEDKILSRSEAAKFLSVSLPTLWEWTKNKKVNAYGIGNRVYYKKSELLSSLKPLNSKGDE